MTRMTGSNTPIPYVVTASSQGVVGSTQEAWHAFDGDHNYAWLSQQFDSPAWIQLDWGPGGGRVLKSYSLWGGEGFFPQRNPGHWKIEGSNNLVDWFLLDERSGYNTASWLATHLKKFRYQHEPGAYRYTRMTVIATADPGTADGWTAVNEWTVSDLGNVSLLY